MLSDLSFLEIHSIGEKITGVDLKIEGDTKIGSVNQQNKYKINEMTKQKSIVFKKRKWRPSEKSQTTNWSEHNQ